MNSLPRSLQVLCAAAIDYAGAFPPAQLPVEQCVRNYQEYQKGDWAWLLGKLVLPLQAYAQLKETTVSTAPFSLVAPSLKALHEQETLTSLSGISAFEIKVSVDSLKSLWLPESFGAAVGEASGTGNARYCYVEVDFPQPQRDFTAWLEAVETLAGELVRLNRASTGRRFALKFRCGGRGPEEIPSAEQLLGGFEFAQRCGLACKLTGGLHAPLFGNERYREGHYGFLTTLFAAAAAYHLQPQRKELIKVLTTAAWETLTCTDESLRIGELELTTSQLESARKQFCHAFGSCSFDEPKDFLSSYRSCP